MGLDMYALTIPANLAGDVQVDAQLRELVGEDGPEIVEFDYWRKHHDLHGWMEQLYRAKGGKAESFNCVTLRLNSEDLDVLEAAIKGYKLPHTTGFFFGDYPPDEESNASDLEFVAKARELIANGQAVFYYSWW